MVWEEVSGDIAARPGKGEESLGPVSDMIDGLGEMPQTSLVTAPHCSPSNVRSTGLACPNFSLTFVMGYTGTRATLRRRALTRGYSKWD